MPRDAERHRKTTALWRKNFPEKCKAGAKRYREANKAALKLSAIAGIGVKEARKQIEECNEKRRRQTEGREIRTRRMQAIVLVDQHGKAKGLILA